ncbi:(R)-mandelonitrile lyase 3 [Morus notabilis]|uniref:(R)-mandelonitrile lyase n=1 Tax=Morus notabilis TaxID=981085 RepID=W9RK56_9ROSA|nr:(R)-mandelonitrile lyase 3 [Morus notabilis]
MALPSNLSLLLLILFSFHSQLLQVHAFTTRSDQDFSFMKSVRNAIDMASEEKYDYIVIGGGTAGCPLAATLSEKHSVLVLERGGTPGTYPNVLNVAGFFANLMQSVVFRPNLAVWQSVVKEALLEAGVGPDNGLSVILNTDIFFEMTEPSAVGVIYTDSNGKSHKALIRKRGEIILSAGAIGSPQLLLLSGVGSDTYLSSQNISVIHSQPNVGKFMADNPRNNINLVIPFPFEASSAQVVGITSDYYIEAFSLSLSFFPIPLPFSLYPSSVSTELSLASIVEKIAGPLSHGSLQLASPNDVKVAPHVGFNYFADPVDLSRCVSGVRKIGDLLNTNSMDPFKYKAFNGERGFMFLGPALPSNNSDDSAMEDYCRSTVTTFWHYHGGCLVGKVVDGDFRVMGVNSLRVVDGSTFILSPGTNPQATLMMLGRYMGLKMLRERRQPIS